MKPEASNTQSLNDTCSASDARLLIWRGPAPLPDRTQPSKRRLPLTGWCVPFARTSHTPRDALSNIRQLRYVTSIGRLDDLRFETFIATREQLLLQNTQFSIRTRQMLNDGSPGSMSMPHSGSAPFVCLKVQLRIVKSSTDIKLVPCRAWPEHMRFSMSPCFTFST